MSISGGPTRARSLGVIVRHAAVLAALAVAVTSRVVAQRRPGLGTGFYTTTGLVTGDVEGGSITSSTAVVATPTFGVSLLLTAPLDKLPKRAWIAGVRAGVLNLGNRGTCLNRPEANGCQVRRFDERMALMAGGSFDIRSTVLRAMIGPALYSVEHQGARLGTAVRLDYASPRLRGPTPTIFYTGTFLGSQRGESVVLSTLGAGFRWVRKR